MYCILNLVFMTFGIFMEFKMSGRFFLLQKIHEKYYFGLYESAFLECAYMEYCI